MARSEAPESKAPEVLPASPTQRRWEPKPTLAWAAERPAGPGPPQGGPAATPQGSRRLQILSALEAAGIVAHVEVNSPSEFKVIVPAWAPPLE